jgi:hypothetical protein
LNCTITAKTHLLALLDLNESKGNFATIRQNSQSENKAEGKRQKAKTGNGLLFLPFNFYFCLVFRVFRAPLCPCGKNILLPTASFLKTKLVNLTGKRI